MPSADRATRGPTRTRIPLPLRAEVRRQLTRRRTQLAFGLVLALPWILVGAFAIAGQQADEGGSDFVDLATAGSLNFTVFTLAATTTFVLVVLAALFSGDAVASEAGWGTLRYLLAAPVRRSRLLRQKLLVGWGSFVVSLLVLVGSCLAIGALFYGWTDLVTPVGTALPAGTALVRVLAATAYIAVSLASVGALAFFLGTRTDAPLGAVGGAVLVVIVSAILDAITALGDWRQLLPTHDQFAWVTLLSESPDLEGVWRGATVSLVYAGLLLLASWWTFTRKDILS